MARVFLINPPMTEPVKTPLLSFCYLASALRESGHDAAVLDASAPFAPSDAREIQEMVERFDPDLVGIHMKTLHVQASYALARPLSALWPLVAGGPHATICPEEPLSRGFRFVVRGEGEETLVELADALDGKRDLGTVSSLSHTHENGDIRHNPPRELLYDLDRLPSPAAALGLFHPFWYGSRRPLPPAGILSSRGCPAGCTFCANNVTGRRFRYRSAASVAAEVRDLREQFDLAAFSFFDDSFAVGRRRVHEVCEALRDLGEPVWWTCTAHPAHLHPDVLAEMKSAGCAGVDLGMESADPGRLIRIGKGVTVERVLDVLRWCHDLEIHTVVNLMFGWPDETEEEIRAAFAFMVRASPLAGGFNARGVLVPHPGTAIYHRNHERFEFTGWWVREAPLPYAPFPSEWSEAEVRRCYAEDPALERNFFRHSAHHRELIAEALALKAELTLEAIARRSDPTVGVPAAGAR